MAGLPVSRGSELPRPVTSLVGREREIAAVASLIARSGARLVTLTGPGGIGKTRLALAVAGQIGEDFSDGVWFVSLASIADPSLVVPAMARVLGVDEQAGHPMLERLTGHLNNRQALLVLDNFEHVLAASTAIAQLLAACPRLAFLVTSREPLHLSGENEYPVPPLGLPVVSNGKADASPPDDGDAVRLFVERARLVAPGFALTIDNAPVNTEICRRLEGLPLALELAAARIKLLSPGELLERLDQPLTLLTGGPRDAPQRQQTMRDTLQWSYDLLTDEERQLFRCLAVFAGGATLDAVEAVASHQHVLETLASLVDKSLVQRADRAGQPARYDMLGPVRQFALERLMERAGEASTARDQHAGYFLSLVDGLKARLDGPRAQQWFERIDAEHDNLRAVLSWLRESGQAEPGLRLAGDLAIFWHQRGYISEGRAHAEAFLSSSDPSLRTIERARTLCFGSLMWIDQGEVEAPLLMTDEARSIAEERGDRSMMAHAHFTQGLCYSRLGDEKRARSEWERALLLFRELGDSRMVARVLIHLGTNARHRGDADRARALLEEALTLARAGNLKALTALALGALGRMAEQSGDDQRALDLYRERLLLHQELGIPRGMAESIERIACLTRRRQGHGHAVRLLGAASSLREQSGTLNFRFTFDADIDAELRALRSAMLEDDFRDAWERGRAMTLADAIELALELAGTGRGRSLSAPPFGLTPREIEVLGFIARRCSNREIAAALFISTRTVERHIENLYRKLDVHSRAEAIDFGRRYLE